MTKPYEKENSRVYLENELIEIFDCASIRDQCA